MIAVQKSETKRRDMLQTMPFASGHLCPFVDGDMWVVSLAAYLPLWGLQHSAAGAFWHFLTKWRKVVRHSALASRAVSVYFSVCIFIYGVWFSGYNPTFVPPCSRIVSGRDYWRWQGMCGLSRQYYWKKQEQTLHSQFWKIQLNPGWIRYNNNKSMTQNIFCCVVYLHTANFSFKVSRVMLTYTHPRQL